MFSGFLFRFLLLCTADFIIILYVLRYARGVRSGKIQSITADLDFDKLRMYYSEEMKEPLTKGQSISLLFFIVIFICAIAGIPLKKWWKFVTPLIMMLFLLCIIALIVATKIHYGPF